MPETEGLNPDIATPPEFHNIGALRKNPLWGQVTAKQRRFIELYVESSRDHIAAASGSHNTKSRDSANTIGLKLVKHPLIRQLLAAFYGYDLEGSLVSRTEFMLLLSKRLRDPDAPSNEWHRLSQTYRSMRGWKMRTAPSSPPRSAATGQAPPPDAAPDLDEMVRRMEAEKEAE